MRNRLLLLFVRKHSTFERKIGRWSLCFSGSFVQNADWSYSLMASSSLTRYSYVPPSSTRKWQVLRNMSWQHLEENRFLKVRAAADMYINVISGITDNQLIKLQASVLRINSPFVSAWSVNKLIVVGFSLPKLSKDAFFSHVSLHAPTSFTYHVSTVQFFPLFFPFSLPCFSSLEKKIWKKYEC